MYEYKGKWAHFINVPSLVIFESVPNNKCRTEYITNI